MKNASKTTAAMLLLVVLMLTMLAVGCAGQSDASGKTSGNSSGAKSAVTASTDMTSAAKAPYADTLFDTTRVHTIEVTMPEKDRASQLATPKDKTKYAADVVIDGEKVENASFHTKGNSSLHFIADTGRDKFSYGINFGKNVKGQSFHGLDKLNLQNNFLDASQMKEYLSYWLFRKMGVDAPLASYVWLTVNGQDQGLYLAVEDVDDSFFERTAREGGAAYKPEAQGLALDEDEMDKINEGGSAAHEGTGGADLVYRGDDAGSYPDIFENAITGKDEGARPRVIESLKALSAKTDLESHLGTAEVIWYFAVHNFLVNYDSYTGPMLHNYVLYEKDGKLAMLPWDYDFAFGSFPVEATIDAAIDSSDVVNAGIDSPVGGAADEARPMWNWILSDEKYLGEYHDALGELAAFVGSGEFASEADRIRQLISPYIDKDPKCIYTPDECAKAYDTAVGVLALRAESVQKQLDGRLATKSDMQAAEDKVDASKIVIADMGSFEKL